MITALISRVHTVLIMVVSFCYNDTIENLISQLISLSVFTMLLYIPLKDESQIRCGCFETTTTLKTSYLKIHYATIFYMTNGDSIIYANKFAYKQKTITLDL